MAIKAQIKETFLSIQGEGPFVGYKQFFIRFCGCNLTCKYCDTDFKRDNLCKAYSAKELASLVSINKDCHSLSLTGGEPLLHTDFLKEFLPICNLPIYLETNGTLYNELEDVIELVDYISMDIKLPSATGLDDLWETHEKFISIANKQKLFAKIVFDENITDDEIFKCCTLAKKYDIELILQPKMEGNNLTVNGIFITKVLDKFLKQYSKTRLIPQTHKFIEVI